MVLHCQEELVDAEVLEPRELAGSEEQFAQVERPARALEGLPDARQTRLQPSQAGRQRPRRQGAAAGAAREDASLDRGLRSDRPGAGALPCASVGYTRQKGRADPQGKTGERSPKYATLPTVWNFFRRPLLRYRCANSWL